jgi:hypothetical protein
VEIHPSRPRGHQFAPSRPPVRLDRVAEASEGRENIGLATGIECKGQVAVLAGLLADQRINSPPADDPNRHLGFSNADSTSRTARAAPVAIVPVPDGSEMRRRGVADSSAGVSMRERHQRWNE